MSANRERNFNRPSLENPLSSRSRHEVRVYDRESGERLFTGTRAEVSGESVIVKGYSGAQAFSLRNVNVKSDHDSEIKAAETGNK